MPLGMPSASATCCSQAVSLTVSVSPSQVSIWTDFTRLTDGAVALQIADEIVLHDRPVIPDGMAFVERDRSARRNRDSTDPMNGDGHRRRKIPRPRPWRLLPLFCAQAGPRPFNQTIVVKLPSCTTPSLWFRTSTLRTRTPRSPLEVSRLLATVGAHADRVAEHHRQLEAPVDPEQRHGAAVEIPAPIDQPGGDDEAQQPMGNRRLEGPRLGIFVIGMGRIEIAGESGKAHHIGFRDGAPRRHLLMRLR